MTQRRGLDQGQVDSQGEADRAVPPANGGSSGKLTGRVKRARMAIKLAGFSGAIPGNASPKDPSNRPRVFAAGTAAKRAELAETIAQRRPHVTDFIVIAMIDEI